MICTASHAFSAVFYARMHFMHARIFRKRRVYYNNERYRRNCELTLECDSAFARRHHYHHRFPNKCRNTSFSSFEPVDLIMLRLIYILFYLYIYISKSSI